MGHFTVCQTYYYKILFLLTQFSQGIILLTFCQGYKTKNTDDNKYVDQDAYIYLYICNQLTNKVQIPIRTIIAISNYFIKVKYIYLNLTI